MDSAFMAISERSALLKTRRYRRKMTASSQELEPFHSKILNFDLRCKQFMRW